MIGRCTDCRFFDSWGDDEGGHEEGQCRRYPPTMSDAMVKEQAKTMSCEREEVLSISTERAVCMQVVYRFPIISGDDWCGEWQAVKRPVSRR